MFHRFLAAASGVAAMSVLSGAAIAQTAAPAAGAASAPPVKEKKICRTETDTGSIMPKRTCHTQAEWQALSQANRGAMGEMRDQQDRQQMVQGALNR